MGPSTLEHPQRALYEVPTMALCQWDRIEPESTHSKAHYTHLFTFEGWAARFFSLHVWRVCCSLHLPLYVFGSHHHGIDRSREAQKVVVHIERGRTNATTEWRRAPFERVLQCKESPKQRPPFHSLRGWCMSPAHSVRRLYHLPPFHPQLHEIPSFIPSPPLTWLLSGIEGRGSNP
jgi:hypothetical protein